MKHAYTLEPFVSASTQEIRNFILFQKLRIHRLDKSTVESQAFTFILRHLVSVPKNIVPSDRLTRNLSGSSPVQSVFICKKIYVFYLQPNAVKCVIKCFRVDKKRFVSAQNIFMNFSILIK